MKNKIIISVLLAAVFCLAGCSQPEEGKNPQKTLFDRAKELSEYYDKIPASYGELTGAETAQENGENQIAPQGDIEAASAELKVVPVAGGVTQLTPDYRPQTGGGGDQDRYVLSEVDQIIQPAKETANYAKGLFQTYSSLNEWIGGAKAENITYAFRLNYDKQFDRIKVEEYELNTAENAIYYDLMYLHLEKGHKINFSWTRYCAAYDTGAVNIVYFYEYAEDDYYYYCVKNARDLDAFSTILYIDLKCNPTEIFYSTGVLNEGYQGQPWRKAIVLDFEDGKKLVYQEDADLKAFGKPEYAPTKNIRLYDENRDIMLAWEDSQFRVDLWQTTGWTSVVPNAYGWSDGYTFNTSNGAYVVSKTNGSEGEKLLNDENPFVTLLAEPWFEDNNYFSATIKLVYDDKTQNTIENMQSALAKLGLSLKGDFDEFFEEYFEDGYEAEIARYDCPKVNFQAMAWEDFKSHIAKTDDGKMTEFLESFNEISVTDSLEAQERKDGSSAYAMLETVFEGGAEVDFDGLTVGFSGLKVTVSESVLHVEGAKYSLKVGLYNGSSFIELAKGEAAYNNAEMVIGVPTNGGASLFENLQSDTQYTLVAYLCNESGMRCSDFFYPDVKEDGQGEKTVNDAGAEMKISVVVKNKTLTVYKSQK